MQNTTPMPIPVMAHTLFQSTTNVIILQWNIAVLLGWVSEFLVA